LENKDEIARKVGICGVKFIYLKNSREKEITFDIKEVLNFDGETGPYVQYTYARARSILRKNPISGEGDLSALTQKEEFELAKVLEGFNKAVLESIDKYEPSVVTRYVLETAKAFNKFYNNIQISNSESSLKNARLQLTSATCQVIKSALGLLGIEVVDRM
jgi:arginyl-tRNA synthetase